MRWLEDRPVAHCLFLALVLCGLVAALLLVSGCRVGGEDPDGHERASVVPSRAVG